MSRNRTTTILSLILGFVVAAAPLLGGQKPQNPGNSGNAPGQSQQNNGSGNGNGSSNAGGNGAVNGNAGGNGSSNAGGNGAANGNAGGNSQSGTNGQSGSAAGSQNQGTSGAGMAVQKAAVIWEMTPAAVAAALRENGIVTIPFHVSARLENTDFWLTPSLQTYLEVLTAPFAVLEPDVTYELEIGWKGEPANKTVGGTLHLVPAKEAGVQSRRTYSQPLAINVKPAGDLTDSDPEEPQTPLEQVLTIVSSLTYQGPPIAPLQIVSIYGFGIGPEEFQPAIVEDGKITDYLADVQVLFDGTAAPIIYAASGELKVVVPSDVAGKTTVDLTVTFLGKVWEIKDIPVVESSPEIFSMNGLGHGMAIAYDADGNKIDETNPVQPGEIITFFGTGVGLWKDGFIDGTIVDPESLPVPKKPVDVFIGGAAAKALFIGGAPGLVNAIVQFNVVVPAEMPELDTATTPAKAAIKVTSAGHESKAEIFIYIE